MLTQLRLSEPSSEERAHSDALAAVIRAEIQRAGPIAFQRWMQLCLYAPGLGYYSAGRTKFGAAGDFVTAPELGALFAGCLAHALVPVLQETGGELIEVGAGTGALAAELLPALARLDALPTRYRILETSADLRARQRERLEQLPPDLLARVEWLQRPPEQPWRGALLANEVLDALPVRRFVLSADGIGEECVGIDGSGRLVRIDRPADAGLCEQVTKLLGPDTSSYPLPYRSEWLPHLEAWLRALLEQLASGVALLIDYGHARREYYHPSRREGTLTCHYRQRVHDDYLWLPGLQDLTAWVDFSAVAEAGRAVGLVPACYATQSAFLLAAGLPELFQAQVSDNAGATFKLAQEVKRLTLPGEMGERFKLLALTRAFDPRHLPWIGIDQSDRL